MAACRSPKYSTSTGVPSDARSDRQVAVDDPATHGVAVVRRRHVAHDAVAGPDRLLAHHDDRRIVERHARQLVRVDRAPGSPPAQRVPGSRPCPCAPRTPAPPRTDRARCGCPAPTAGSPSPAGASRTRPSPPRRSRARGRPRHSRSHARSPMANWPYSSQPSSPAYEMRCAHTGPTSPTFRYFAVRYGNASFDTSASVTAAEHVARPRTPQPEREQRAGPLGDRHALAVADLRAHPRQVVLARAAARHDPEELLVLARHGQVAPDPARRREHGRVDDRADGPVDPVGADPLEVRERVRSRSRRTSRTA